MLAPHVLRKYENDATFRQGDTVEIIDETGAVVGKIDPEDMSFLPPPLSAEEREIFDAIMRDATEKLRLPVNLVEVDSDAHNYSSARICG